MIQLIHIYNAHTSFDKKYMFHLFFLEVCVVLWLNEIASLTIYKIQRVFNFKVIHNFTLGKLHGLYFSDSAR